MKALQRFLKSAYRNGAKKTRRGRNHNNLSPLRAVFGWSTLDRKVVDSGRLADKPQIMLPLSNMVSASSKAQLMSTLTCPLCGRSELLEMPEDRCVFFHQCPACKEVLKPNKGDCCVFCSFGDTDCPPKKHAHCQLTRNS